ncbi:basic amino acid/polyamine antiporter, APA family [Streptoalloteichus tenebrarius]|uniref:Basic amino acid/polyamine antiporter, APA family n=1 Tax=Streptoalloteichus tenebrarius (strain ATCC 17920 / DSM 40477 / JCM 4838 / CBS 697.72 / NBRC 16177 / NCIMB 11028 / NRRL B-12390 / A12253. 1 / ISP 5477) TaxID=1933 RepID=A0ABT1HPC3_STRSD|nr:amino acid permease [Streptoalloteichus tenebrarius]MCP2257351.1 basic amino acid/polyamine antiporter, APA family [Streptoalloteichus tenebrarius]
MRDSGATTVAPARPTDSGGGRRSRGFGLATAVTLVMGNIIGGGIFTLPAAVAPYGTVSLLAFAVLTLGAVALALLFGRLAERSPVTGGLYVYPRDAFGRFAGFLSAWSYWTMTWASNAALAVAAVGYVDVLVPLHGNAAAQASVALACLWLPTLAHLAGARSVGVVQIVSTVLKFVPLLLVAVGGLFFVRAENFGSFDATGEGWPGALSASAALLLYSYLGVESAAMSAGEVRDPRRNVRRASVLGTVASAVVYLLGIVSVFGVVPHDRLVGSSAPFADAVNTMIGGSAGGVAVAMAAVVSIVGALNGWILMSGQMSYAAALDGLFPAAFARRRRDVPRFGVLVSVLLASAMIVLNYVGGAATVFQSLVLVTSFTAAVPYLLSAAAQLRWLLAGSRARVRPLRLGRDLLVAGVSFGFSLWLIAGAGQAAVYQGTLLLFAGVLVYAWLAGRGSGHLPGRDEPAGDAEAAPLAEAAGDAQPAAVNEEPAPALSGTRDR